MKRISRRTVLKGAGVSLGLPLLNIMADSKKAVVKTKRFVVAQTSLGIYADTFFPKPEDIGFNYKMPSVLKVLEPYRKDFTVFSNIDHGMAGGHGATHALLSGVKHGDASKNPDGNISLDQRIADHVGNKTRINSLLLGNVGQAGGGWTRNGTYRPRITLEDAYEAMFLKDSEEAKKAKREYLSKGKSVLDAARDQAKTIQKTLGKEDKEKLDEYFTSLRGTEKKIQSTGVWIDKPKPKVKMNLEGKKTDLERELTVLALQTDSTRVVYLDMLNEKEDLPLIKIDKGYHSLSHHSMRPDLIKELQIVERHFLTNFGKLIKSLKKTKDVTGASLLDSTLLMYGSGMGCGSKHTSINMPVILSGGGIKHQGHVNNDFKQPLNNLYLSILQWFGVETNYFNTTEKTYSGMSLS